MKKRKKPRFYCDACAAEVAADADRCPHCGKYFSSVRCPKCFWTGEHSEFTHGCPNCGYSVPIGKNNSPKKNSSKKGNTYFDDMPSWILPLAILLFVLIFVLLFFK